MSPDYLRQAAAAATAAGLPPGGDLFSMHAASVTPSMGIPFSSEGTRFFVNLLGLIMHCGILQKKFFSKTRKKCMK